MMNGIDVSKHNGSIDWKNVKAQGIDFAIIRAGYGRFDNQKDERFEEYYRLAKKEGIKLGAYLYSYAKSVAEAEKEAEIFIKWLKGKQFEMPVFYDVEEKSQSLKGKKFVSDIVKAFCQKLERAGYYVGIYASKYWLENYIDDECKQKYDVWVAQWTSQNSYKGQYGMWQYSATGKISGVNSGVDLDKSYKDYPSIIISGGFNGFKKSNSAKKPEGAPDKQPEKATSEKSESYKAGTKIRIVNAPLYVSSTAKTPSVKKKTGNFYIYDGIEINSRYRITTRKDYVKSKPLDKKVTGYINKSDINKVI